MSTLAPPVPYFGGKQRLAERIVEHFPEHTHYVEPFCGSLSVLLAKPPGSRETVNDLDGDVVTFWRILRDRPDDLERVCALTPHARAEVLLARELDVDDLERARRVWVQLTQARAAQLRPTGWRFNISSRSAPRFAMVDYLNGYLARMAPAAERLRRVSLECRPAADVIAAYGADPDVLLYVDPPYLADVRNTKGSGAYQHEMLHPGQHRELAEQLRACTATVVLSGYASDLYDVDLYPDWDRVELRAFTGQGNAPASQAARTEVLWSNRPMRRAIEPLFDVS